MKNTKHYNHVAGLIVTQDWVYWTDPNNGEESDYHIAHHILADLVDIGRDQMVPLSECEKVIPLYEHSKTTH